MSSTFVELINRTCTLNLPGALSALYSQERKEHWTFGDAWDSFSIYTRKSLPRFNVVVESQSTLDLNAVLYFHFLEKQNFLAEQNAQQVTSSEPCDDGNATKDLHGRITMHTFCKRSTPPFCNTHYAKNSLWQSVRYR